MVTLLVADDAMFLRKLVKIYVQDSEFEVIGEAGNGREAVELYKQLKPQIVTMDITMPEKDGLQAVKEIIRIDPSAKIVVCSAMGQKEFVVDAVEAGAAGYVIKPFSPEMLLTGLREVVKGGSREREFLIQKS